MNNKMMGKWTGKIRVIHQGLKLQQAEISKEMINTVYSGLLEERKISMEYLSRESGQLSSYEINPLGLVFRGAAIYLVCTMWKYKDIRQLALHRIKDAKILDEEREIPKGFTLDHYIDEGAFGYPVKESLIKIEVAFDSAAAYHLYETPISSNQTISGTGKRVIIKATVNDSQELRWWLLGFGDQIEILKPAFLREEFALIVKNLYGQYSN